MEGDYAVFRKWLEARITALSADVRLAEEEIEAMKEAVRIPRNTLAHLESALQDLSRAEEWEKEGGAEWTPPL